MSELVSNTDRLIRTDTRATHPGQERCVLHKRPNTFAQTCLLALSSFLAVGRRTIHIRTFEPPASVGKSSAPLVIAFGSVLRMTSLYVNSLARALAWLVSA